VISLASMPLITFCFVCFYQPAFSRVCVFINKEIKKLKLKVSLSEATIFFKHTLWSIRTACVAKHFLLSKFLPRHKAAQKKFCASLQTSESNAKQAKAETRYPLKIISGTTDSMSQPQVKAQQQVRASQMQSYVTRTCCWILNACNSPIKFKPQNKIP